MKLLIELVREIYICQEKVREFKKSLAVATMLLHYCCKLVPIVIVTSSALIPLW